MATRTVIALASFVLFVTCSSKEQSTSRTNEKPLSGSSTTTLKTDSASVVTVSDSAQNSENYISFRYQRIPPNNDFEAGGAKLKSLGGVLIDLESEQPYSLHQVVEGVTKMLWLEKRLRDDQGKKYWEVRAVLTLPRIGDDEVLVCGGVPLSPCKIEGISDPEIFAIAKYEDKEFFTTIKRAWRANRQLERFEEISSNGIICSNEGYGVE